MTKQTIEMNRIYNEHVLDFLARVPDEFFDAVITSPPYFGQRSYKTVPQIWGGDRECEHQWKTEITKRPNAAGGKGKTVISNEAAHHVDYHKRQSESEYCSKCKAWRGELGLEPTVQEFIEHLIMIFREIHRCLKKTGTVWVNLGDSYAANWNSLRDQGSGFKNNDRERTRQTVGFKNKTLLNIPARFNIAMTDELQMIQRNNINWFKPSCKPESATDRFTVDFELIGFFTKISQGYFFEQQFERFETFLPKSTKVLHPGQNKGVPHNRAGNGKAEGRNMRATWAVNYETSGIKHFASYPTRLVELPVLAGCPLEVCVKCGSPKELTDYVETGETFTDLFGEVVKETKMVKHPGCECKAEYRPGIVFDPFSGTATTAVVAHKLGRNFIGTELQMDYFTAANERLKNVMAQGGLF